MKLATLLILIFSVSNLWGEASFKLSPKFSEELTSYATNLPLTCSIKECLKSKDVQWKVYGEPTSEIIFYTYSSKHHSDLLFSSLRSCFEEPTINTPTGSLPDGSIYFTKFVLEGNKKLNMTLYPPTYKKSDSTKSANKDCKEMITSEDVFETQSPNVFL